VVMLQSLFCMVFTEEDLTLDSFKLLSEPDLSELGFKMGSRKLLMQWISEQSAGILFAVKSVSKRLDFWCCKAGSVYFDDRKSV